MSDLSPSVPLDTDGEIPLCSSDLGTRHAIADLRAIEAEQLLAELRLDLSRLVRQATQTGRELRVLGHHPSLQGFRVI
jgi:hypothetical protein